MKLAELLKNYDKSEICWYSSSGGDLQNLSLWQNGYGNTRMPKLFILTDVAYQISNREVIYRYNQKDKKLADIIADNIIEDLNKFTKNGYLDTLSPDMADELVNNQKHLLNEEDKHLLDIGILDPIDLIRNNDNYHLEIPFSEGLLINNGHLQILYLSVENESFYKYCIANSIKISCLMAQATADVWISDGIHFDTLEICELMKGDHGITPNNIPPTFKKIKIFDWQTHQHPDGSGSFWRNENC